MDNLILSVFPGIDLLGKAFEEEGYCVVRGPDRLWGGDIKAFHPPASAFVGILGGLTSFIGLGILGYQSSSWLYKALKVRKRAWTVSGASSKLLSQDWIGLGVSGKSGNARWKRAR